MLRIENISKVFASQSQQAAVCNLSLTIARGEFLSLLGPSGCGKTTLLRMIAGLDVPTSGRIFFTEQDITSLPAQQRPFNLIFQKYALFPHLNVFDNIAFGLRIKKLAETEIRQRVYSALEMINLQTFALRFPHTLSGGQAQRVALARALVNNPEVLLLDEPLSALDKNMRTHLQNELRQLQKDLGITFVFVTHDQEEAFALSDRIVLMNNGRIVQQGHPAQIYSDPNCLFSLQFVGVSANLKVAKLIHLQNDTFLASLSDGQQVKATLHPTCNLDKSQNISLCFRPEQIQLASHANASPLKARATTQIFKGDHLLVHFSLQHGEMFWAQLPIEKKPKENEVIELYLAHQNAKLFNSEIPLHD